MGGAGDPTNHHKHLKWLHWQMYAIGGKDADMNVEQDEALNQERLRIT